MNTQEKVTARGPWLRAVAGLILPPILALALFAAAIGAVIVPAAEEALIERKRETLRAVVASAISLLARHEARAAAGSADPQQARRAALDELRALRYGDAGKDYLWVMDREPRMVMHPYRPDLEGQSLAEYRDKAGKRVFVESLNIVKASGEGYVDYFWQWQDDAGRIEPKLSFIREFKPWGLIVGTGLYLDDVQAGLRQLAGRLYGIAAFAGAGMLILLAIGMRQGWRAERRRRAAELELAASRESYRALAHASADMAILFLDGRVAGANRAASDWLGLEERELLGRPVESILRQERDFDLIRAVRESSLAPERETLLAGQGRDVPVLLSCSVVHISGQAAVMLAGRDLRPAAAAETDDGAAEQAGLGRLDLSADGALTILSASPAACRMLDAGGERAGAGKPLSAFLPDPEFALLRHELSRGVVPGMLVGTRGGRTLQIWAARAGQAAACHALVADATGAVSRRKAQEAWVGAGIPLPGASSEADATEGRARLQAWCESAVRAGVHPELVVGPLGLFADRLIRQACARALAEEGQPPAPVSLLAVGSIGRGEPTFNPDQDFALLLADGVDYGDWPARFGEAVTRRLEACGLPPCKAGHTAANADWRLTRQAWQDRFSHWIRNAEPKALMEVNIFFDFRAVWGEEQPADELRRHIFTCVAERPVFLRHLAADTMEFRAPLDLLGRIRPDHPGDDHTDIKGAMLHIVNFTRIYSLRHQIAETGTAARLCALGRGAHLPPDTVQDTLDAWHHLLALRLRLQVGRLDRGLAPENLAVLSSLTAWDRSLLKLALGQIANLQQRLATEILRTS
jgi:PAS domain S-box-containing protein